MTDDDKRENDEKGVTRATRRDVLMGGAASAIGMAGLTMATEDAEAQSDDHRLQLGTEWSLDDNADRLDLRYGGSGAGTVDAHGQKMDDLGELNTADLANATADTVAVSQGDGTLTMEAQSGGGASKTTARRYGLLGGN